MIPLGIVFILEVDDWAVNIYLMLEFEDDDGDDDYDGGEELWVIETSRNHIKTFKLILFIVTLCMIIPPMIIRIIYEFIWSDPEKLSNPDYFMWDTNMFSGGMATITYSIIGCI